ncbi:MAG: adenylate/guanylate cyclase domain-containing protein, partial [Actinomycetota bacterium]
GLLGMGKIEEGLALHTESYQRCRDGGYWWYASNIAWNENWNRAHMMQPGGDDVVAVLLELASDRSEAPIWLSTASAYALRTSGLIQEMLSKAQEAFDLGARDGYSRMTYRAQLLVAEALVELGRIDEAKATLPDRSSRVEMQDLIYDTPAQVKTLLAAGDIEGAVRQAKEVMQVASRLNIYRITLAWAAEAFFAAEMLPEVESLLKAGRSAPTTAGDAYLDQMEGRLQMAKGNAAQAVELIQHAIKDFAAAGFVLEGLRANIWMAKARAEIGDDDQAIKGLQAVIDEASRLGAELIRSEAIRMANDLGLAITETVSVSEPSEGPPELIDLGEKMVTVMFADVRGYTAMTEHTSPEEMADRIGSLHRWSKREIEKHHGLVDKFAGDAVMATFNVSGATVDHCDHALQAALALKDKAALMDMEVGIGIAVGPAIVGRLTEGGNVTALGTTTNLAARLQTTAAGGEVLLSEEAYERVAKSLSRRGVSAERSETELKGLGLTTFYRMT